MSSKGINRVILIGNVGKDPETKYMPNGDAVTNLTLATSESWKDKNTGEQKEVTEWHRVTFYRKLAEVVAQYVKKGSKLYIEGSLRTRSWEQDGIKKYSTEIIASEMQMLDGKPSQDSASSGGSSQGAAKSHRAPPVADSFDDGFGDSSIPF